MGLNYEQLKLKDLLKLSKKGDLTAAYLAAQKYLEEKDYQNAVKQFEIATQKGCQNGQVFYEYALLYYFGKYIPQDYKKAFALFSSGSFFGHPRACLFLAYCYEHGLGVEEDYSKAYLTYSMGADLGDPDCKKWVEEKEKEIKVEEIVVKQFDEKEEIVVKQFDEEPPKEIKITSDEDYKKLSQEQLEQLYNKGDFKTCVYLGDTYFEKKQYDKAFPLYLKGYEELKDYGCANRVGLCYSQGRYVAQDHQKALDYFKIAAQNGYAGAVFNIGVCYEKGYGLNINRPKAIYYYKKAALMGSQPAKNRLRKLGIPEIPTYKGKPVRYSDLTIEQLEEIYQSGDYNVCAELGRRYYQNEEHIKAFKVFHKGYLEVQNYYCACALGFFYYEGKYITQDYQRAFEYFKFSADKEYPTAQFYIGLFYYKGLYVKKDYTKAFEWFKKAADQKDISSISNLGLLYEMGYGVKQDYVKAAELYQEAADHGDAYAQNNLGDLYFDGHGVKQDYIKAAQYYYEAAEQGNEAAQCNLAHLYVDGLGVKQNYGEAVKWLKKAADQNDPQAINNLGWLYEMGYGVKQDSDIAADLYQKAANQGFALAQFNFGLCYLYGRGIFENRKLAIYWLKKAADQGHQSAIDKLNELGYYYIK